MITERELNSIMIQIEYGDYVVLMYKLIVNGGDEKWTEIEINN